MVRFIILLIVIAAGIWGYTNFNSIKSKTIDTVQNGQSVQIYNSSINKTQQDIDEALKF